MTIEVIYFSVIVGLSPFEISLAIGAGGLAALLFSVPSGLIADRFGPRRVVFWSHVLEGLLLLPLIFIRDFWALVLVNVLISLVATAGHNATSTLISTMGTGEERVSIRAAQRAMANMGIGFGTVFAGIALWLNTELAYEVTIAFDFLLFMLAARFVLRLPNAKPTTKKGDAISFVALKDYRFLGATLLNGIVSLHFVIQGVALPLWILNYTEVPTWWVSVLFVINTVLVTVLQIRMSRGTGTLMMSVKKFRIGTAYLLLSCVVYGLAADLPIWIAASILVTGMVVHTMGELLAAAGSWSIGFDLAEEKHMGQYQGVYSLGWGLGGSFGPLYVTSMILGFGVAGWWIMGGVFLVAGFLMHVLIKRHPVVKLAPVLPE
jgi:MFS family permease